MCAHMCVCLCVSVYNKTVCLLILLFVKMNTGYINAKGALLLEPIKEHFVEAVLPQSVGPGDHIVPEGTVPCGLLFVPYVKVCVGMRLSF